MIKIVFPRNKWISGAHLTAQYSDRDLLSSCFLFDGERYCAIGLLAKEFGIEDKYLRDRYVLRSNNSKLPVWMRSAAKMGEITDINDSSTLSEEEIYQKLRDKLSEYDIDFILE